MSMLLKKSDLWREVALQNGWGPGLADDGEEWDAEQQLLLKSFVDSGYARFISTPPIQGVHPGGHEWTFLKPTMKLTAPSGVSSLRLPEDFNGFCSPLTIIQTNASNLPVRVGNDSLMAMERQRAPDRTGRPLLVNIRPRKENRQRFDLDLFPITDAEYVFSFAYHLVPEALTDAWPYAYGGAIHRETLLESCLAVAEERWDRVPEGPHFAAFMRCLAASIRKDRELKPQYYGYDKDDSDKMHTQWRDFPPISVNGAVPSSTYT